MDEIKEVGKMLIENPPILTDDELDNIGYPILPLGDRTGSRRVAEAQRDAVLKWFREQGCWLAQIHHEKCPVLQELLKEVQDGH